MKQNTQKHLLLLPRHTTSALAVRGSHRGPRCGYPSYPRPGVPPRSAGPESCTLRRCHDVPETMGNGWVNHGKSNGKKLGEVKCLTIDGFRSYEYSIIFLCFNGSSLKIEGDLIRGFLDKYCPITVTCYPQRFRDRNCCLTCHNVQR